MGFFSVSRGMAGGIRHTDQDEPILSQLKLQEKLKFVTISPVYVGVSTTEHDVKSKAGPRSQCSQSKVLPHSSRLSSAFRPSGGHFLCPSMSD